MSASAVNKFVQQDLTIRLVSSVLCGRHFLHNAVNDLIKRAMTSTETPAVLKPASLSYSDGTDGKIPDGRLDDCAIRPGSHSFKLLRLGS